MREHTVPKRAFKSPVVIKNMTMLQVVVIFGIIFGPFLILNLTTDSFPWKVIFMSPLLILAFVLYNVFAAMNDMLVDHTYTFRAFFDKQTKCSGISKGLFPRRKKGNSIVIRKVKTEMKKKIF